MSCTTSRTLVLTIAATSCGQLLATAVPPVVEHGWLGLSADAYGLYVRPTPALASLHEDYQFLRQHDMPAGRLDLDSVAAFRDSAHIRLQPTLEPHAGSSVASITLELCGGDTTIVLEVTVPAPRMCASQKIFNNSNSVGWTTQIATGAPNKTAGPAWCQSRCCANPECIGFTYTDPQPNDKANGDRYICWQYTGGRMGVTPGGDLCDGSGDGHCWTALGNAPLIGTWSVEVDGVPWAPNGTLKGAPRPVTSTGSTPSSSGVGYHKVDSPLEVFLDGSARQIFFNGNLLTTTTSNCSVANASLTVVGADAVVDLDAWRMVADQHN